MDERRLSLLEIAIGWPLDKLAARSPNVAGLPKSATDHIGAYLNTPVHFHYAGDKVQFDIPLTHTFQVNQQFGRVSAIDVELPMIEQDSEPAFVQLQNWSKKFDGMGIERFYDAKNNCGPRDDIQAARKIVDQDFEMSSASVGCWQDSNVLYFLSITRFKRHVRLTDGSEKEVPVYKVAISIWDKSSFYAFGW